MSSSSNIKQTKTGGNMEPLTFVRRFGDATDEEDQAGTGGGGVKTEPLDEAFDISSERRHGHHSSSDGGKKKSNKSKKHRSRERSESKRKKKKRSRSRSNESRDERRKKKERKHRERSRERSPSRADRRHHREEVEHGYRGSDGDEQYYQPEGKIRRVQEESGGAGGHATAVKIALSTPISSNNNSTDDEGRTHLVAQLGEILGISIGGNNGTALERSPRSPDARILEAVRKLKRAAVEAANDANTIDLLHKLLYLDKNSTFKSTDKHVRLVATVIALKDRADKIAVSTLPDTAITTANNNNNNSFVAAAATINYQSPLINSGTIPPPKVVTPPQNEQKAKRQQNDNSNVVTLSSSSPDEGTECENQPSSPIYNELTIPSVAYYVWIRWTGRVPPDCSIRWLHEKKGRGRALAELIDRVLRIRCIQCNFGGPGEPNLITVQLASVEEAARVETYFDGRTYFGGGVRLRAEKRVLPASIPRSSRTKRCPCPW